MKDNKKTEDQYYYYEDDDGTLLTEENYFNHLSDKEYNRYLKETKAIKRWKANYLGKTIIITVGLFSTVALTTSGYFIYNLAINSTNTNDIQNYVASYDNANNSAANYIAQRSLSLQFLFSTSDSNGYQVVNSTGWILNADTTNNVYYIATNLTSAAYLSYANHSVYQRSSYYSNIWSIKSWGNLLMSFVGYVDPTNISNDVATNVDDVQMLTVANPEIVYTNGIDENWKNIFSKTLSSYYPSETGYYDYNISSDFAVLKYDFSSTSLLSDFVLTTDNKTYNNTSSEYEAFNSWLQYYNNDPTAFLTTAIEDLKIDNKQVLYSSLYYSLGGFVNQETDQTFFEANGLLTKNIANVKFNSSTNVKDEDDYEFTIGDTYRLYNSRNYVPTTTFVDANATTINGVYAGGYVTANHYIKVNGNLTKGSQGSMMITYLDNKPYVVGYTDSYYTSSTYNTTPYLYSNLLFTNNNNTFESYSSKEIIFYSGYNLIELSYNYLINNTTSSVNALRYTYQI